MGLRKITLTSLAIAVTALMTACGSSKSDGGQPTLPLIDNNNTAKNAGKQTTPPTTDNATKKDDDKQTTPPATNNATKNDSKKADLPITDITVNGDELKKSITTEIEPELGPTVQIDSYTVTIGDKAFKDGKGISFKEFGKGYHELPVTEVAQGTGDGGKKGSVERKSNVYLFQQDYSLIAGLDTYQLVVKDGAGKTLDAKNPDDFSLIVKGDATKTLPDSGTFTYKGTGKFGAGDKVLDGDVSYEVDFGAKKGSGKVTGLSGQKDITLETANIEKLPYEGNPDKDIINMHGISGPAQYGQDDRRGTYRLGFFGPKAEEVVGEVRFGDDDKSLRGIFSATKSSETK